MKTTAFLQLCVLICSGTQAQSRFSQFYSNPLLINPANTGRFDKTYRLGGSFRRELNTQN
ncbi:MAG: type IX secretion system membrane protein PorP/SprF, partial [Gloeobacteraceae cyanobacterium ES-bin-316]|nr:type IX secretion system membrane protein PorP/SprF [Ferruginibacter sp.]